MGLSGVSVWELLIILLIVVLIFGTSRLKTLGADLGGAIRSFRQAMDGKNAEPQKPLLAEASKESDTGPTAGERHTDNAPPTAAR
ncbi:MAG TPA: twin-arginine translocase TatA/TatE family subunit [Gammaproteobacteria bacterium]